MSTIIKGGTSGVLADVDANKNLFVNTPMTVAQVGHVACAAEADPGTYAYNPGGLAGRQIKDMDISQDYRLRVGTDTTLFYDNVQGSAINVQLWTYPTATATFAIGSGVVAFNSGNSVAASAVARMSTWRTFPFYQASTTYFEARILITALNSQNVSDFGFGFAATTAEATDGAYFKYDATGNFRCILNFGGTPTTASPVAVPTINQYHHYCIGVSQDYVEFWVDNILYGLIPVPSTQPSPTNSAALPIFIRNYNTASGAGGATQLKLAEAMVSLGELQTNKSWPHIQAGSGLNCYQLPTNVAAVSTFNIANSAAPTNISAPANASAGYAKIAGDFQIKASATAETDYQVFSYQNIGGTAAITGRTLYITGCRIASINFGAIVAASVTTIQWGLAFGCTATDPSTADAAAAKAPRRISLGFQYWAVGAVVGAPANADIDTQFTTPYIVEHNNWVAVFVKFPVGTATTSQTIRGCINLNGYWE